MTDFELARVLVELYARVPLGMRLGLEPMREACAKLGHPEQSFRAVHIAGTNGKGSVSAMVEASARAAGLKTGQYSSPHLVRFAERIRINGVAIEDAELARVLNAAIFDVEELSFFEAATMAAFLAFRENGIDLGIVEVGLGGRLDATNVLPPPKLGAITRIALDHTDRLGTTLVEIAREKAGIAKPGMTLVLGPMPVDVRRAIDEVAIANGATTVSVDESDEAEHFVRDAKIALAGAHQRTNAKVAYAIGKHLDLPETAIRYGLAHVEWPGRLETLETDEACVLLDAAHNPDGAEALAQSLRDRGAKPESTALIFGTLADKTWPPMIDALAPFAASRIYIAPIGRAPTPPEEIAARHPGRMAQSVSEAFGLAVQTLRDRGISPAERLVVVSGSIFLVGQLRARLLNLPTDPPVAL